MKGLAARHWPVTPLDRAWAAGVQAWYLPTSFQHTPSPGETGCRLFFPSRLVLVDRSYMSLWHSCDVLILVCIVQCLDQATSRSITRSCHFWGVMKILESHFQLIWNIKNLPELSRICQDWLFLSNGSLVCTHWPSISPLSPTPGLCACDLDFFTCKWGHAIFVSLFLGYFT